MPVTKLIQPSRQLATVSLGSQTGNGSTVFQSGTPNLPKYNRAQTVYFKFNWLYTDSDEGAYIIAR